MDDFDYWRDENTGNTIGDDFSGAVLRIESFASVADPVTLSALA